MTLDQKLEAFQRAGMHGVAIVRFTPEVARGASILRVHDVRETVDAIRVWQAINQVG